MEKEFIPYTLALELKSLGFDEPCLAYWFNETPTNPQGQCIVYYKKPWDNEKIVKGVIREYCSAPTFSQAFRWFREKYGLHSYIEPVLVEKAISPIKYDYVILEVSHQDDLEYNNLPYHTYEEAELACLEKLIQIVKDGK